MTTVYYHDIVCIMNDTYPQEQGSTAMDFIPNEVYEKKKIIHSQTCPKCGYNWGTPELKKRCIVCNKKLKSND